MQFYTKRMQKYRKYINKRNITKTKSIYTHILIYGCINYWIILCTFANLKKMHLIN